jgi:pimeloyl-ACP methyl ester carboxylesterase
LTQKRPWNIKTIYRVFYTKGSPAKRGGRAIHNGLFDFPSSRTKLWRDIGMVDARSVILDEADVPPPSCSRRTLLAGVVAAEIFTSLGSPALAQTVSSQEIRTPVQTNWGPPPAMDPKYEAVAKLPGGSTLWYWDTRGTGEPIVLLHPATGSAAIWGYQQSAFARAGFRVIGYSRRGHGKSPATKNGDNGSAAQDLLELMNYLKVARFHLVGTAAGGIVAFDFAISFPERLSTLTIANSLGGVSDPTYRAVTHMIIPPGFHDLPASFRELGPSYRAANPGGTNEWARLESISKPAGRVIQKFLNDIGWDDIRAIQTRSLIISSDSDLYMPPTRAREFVAKMPNAKLAVVPEAGHSTYWEQPIAFNDLILRLIKGKL